MNAGLLWGLLAFVAVAAGLFLLLPYLLYLHERVSDILNCLPFKSLLRGVRKGGKTMEIPNRITDFLKKNKVYYQVLVHPKSFTSSQTAKAGHVPGANFLKAVMVKADGKDAMVVLPASRTIDFLKLTGALRSHSVYIEPEKEFKDLFPDCEVGAMPPLGCLYGLPCYVDKSIRGRDTVYLNAGNHEECLEISAHDFLRTVKGVLGDFSVEGRKIREQEAAAV